jgi:predicted O-linked N-acetylglucosamine transferase (SPINDLY family)
MACEALARHRGLPQSLNLAPRKAGRLRVAYVSGMFRDHAGPLLVTGMLEQHDRSEFEIFGICHGSNDNSATRARMVAALDHFIDVPHLSDAAIAETIAGLSIDIAIDLDGYTEDARPGILAHRPAPVQVNFLGFPGSMGAAHMDYIIGDPMVTPPEHAPYFREKIARLPFTYQPNGKRPESAAITRAEAGLPPDAFVFGCFNSNHKITPGDLDSWARILTRVPDSVLWLFTGNETARQNLSREAASRGLDPARLVFAGRVGWETHLARQSLMDLFLDTSIYGAHTTASDLIWAGVPLVTCLGEAFPARVAASILTAAGVPELITHNRQDYENLAVALAGDPARLASLKEKLKATRATMPLFDTARYTRHFEAALRTMAAKGAMPESFDVAP